ncbi:MAG: IS5/IS1182 family transposase [Chloroflexi bacterium]|nr:MAG: IS5/IS1182 family transposase [Chloroflexota bacterium]MBL1193115.1 IS5/IS1182 family transposase [Chloroflexota bacterium]NOH10408.1 transposase [Chloroflexota bacterium]
MPIGLYVTFAKHAEASLAEPTLRTIKVAQPRGRPKTRPKELVADKAYDSRQLRQRLRRRGIKSCIPTFDRRRRKKTKPGRPIRVGSSYRERWKVERCFGWMDNCPRLVVRYERHLYIYRSFCLLALILWSINRILK